MRFKLSLYIYKERQIAMSCSNIMISYAVDSIGVYLNNNLLETKLWDLLWMYCVNRYGEICTIRNLNVIYVQSENFVFKRKKDKYVL